MKLTEAEAGAIVASAREQADGARTLTDALKALARLLMPHCDVARISVRILLPETDMLTIAAVWAPGETAIATGTRMPASATSFPEVVRAGRPIVSGEGLARGVLDDLLFAEGVRSWASIPIRAGGAVVGLLNLSSTTPDACREDHVSFFADLGAAVQETLLGLVERSGTL